MPRMKNNVLLTITSLLSILLLSIHVTDDIVRGFDKWGLDKLSFVLILVVWLCGTLLLAERRSGRVIMLLGGLLAAGMPAIHMRGTGAFVKSGGAFFFIWTLFALGATGSMSVILAARALNKKAAAVDAAAAGVQQMGSKTTGCTAAGS
jgi:hypothetical protein